MNHVRDGLPIMFTSFILISDLKHTNTLSNLVLYPRDHSGGGWSKSKTQGQNYRYLYMDIQGMLRREVYRL